MMMMAIGFDGSVLRSGVHVVSTELDRSYIKFLPPDRRWDIYNGMVSKQGELFLLLNHFCYRGETSLCAIEVIAEKASLLLGCILHLSKRALGVPSRIKTVDCVYCNR
jgi:hypothetical protein